MNGFIQTGDWSKNQACHIRSSDNKNSLFKQEHKEDADHQLADKNKEG